MKFGSGLVKVNGFEGEFKMIGAELGWEGNEEGIGAIVKNVVSGEEITVEPKLIVYKK